MKIEVDVLKSAIERILAHVEETNGKSIDVADDYYWFIPREQLNDPTNEPTELTIGSLEDDWENLVAVGRGDKDAFGYMLVWAASVLRAIGDRTP